MKAMYTVRQQMIFACLVAVGVSASGTRAQGLAGLGELGEDGRCGAGQGSFDRGQQGGGFEGAGGLEEEVDRASAAQAVGDVCGVVEEGGVALDDGAIADHPRPC